MRANTAARRVPEIQTQRVISQRRPFNTTRANVIVVHPPTGKHYRDKLFGELHSFTIWWFFMLSTFGFHCILNVQDSMFF